ncbi:MAG: PCYCGC motif-containing (lipo)protein [Gammaproteobacteria bacterium]
MDRRGFAASCVTSAIGLLMERDGACASRPISRTHVGHHHPEPRAGITAVKLPPANDLREYPEAMPVFEMVRRIPRIIDGIRCYCGCAQSPDFYSLLSCFEGAAMAKRCPHCQAQARLAFFNFERGKSLREIRAAVDAKFA